MPMSNSNSNHVVVGQALSSHNEVGDPVGIPVSEIDRHLMIAGSTGSGKSVTSIHSVLSGHEATDGASIVIDPTGDLSRNLVRSYHARTGSLENVLYFDVAEALPKIAFMDVRPAMNAGRDRGKTVRAISSHFLDLIDHLIPESAEAIRSPTVIRYLLIALLDPIEGTDSIGISDLVTALYRLRKSRTVPDVSTEWAENLLDSITDGNARMFDTVMQGAVTRVEHIYGSGYLRPLFDYNPEDPDDAFRFDNYLQSNQLILFNLAGLPASGQKVVSNALLSLLWRALQRRHARLPPEELKQTLLMIDEVPQLNIENRLSELLALSRGYALGLILLMQYPSQLQEATKNDAAYDEILNNCQSLVLGRVPSDEGLVDRLSGVTMSTGELSNRLGNLPLNRWLFLPASPRGTGRIPPHTIADLPLPLGHPDAGPEARHPNPDEFAAAFAQARQRTEDELSIPPEPYDADAIQNISAPGSELDQDTLAELQATNYETTLPLLDSLPGNAKFDPDRHAVMCDDCAATYPVTFDGVRDAIRCHGDLDSVSCEDIPPIELGLRLTADEIRKSPLTTLQHIALKIIYNMAAERYCRCEIDLVTEPVQHVLSVFGIESDVLSTLEDEGYISRRKLHQHLFFSLTPDGRDAINESHRRGIDWGHCEGALSESLLHVTLVRGLERYMIEEFEDDPDCPVTEVIPYYELTDAEAEKYGLHGSTRIDVVGLTDDGDIWSVGEAELSNNDRASAAIEDYDQFAAINAEEAIWAVSSSSKGHEAVLQPLADPSDVTDIEDTTPRIRSYSDSTRIPTISGIDAPGMTQIMTLNEIRKHISEPTLENPT